jgi:hypothetical protein
VAIFNVRQPPVDGTSVRIGLDVRQRSVQKGGIGFVEIVTPP